MASITLNGASPLNADDGNRLFFNLDTSETQTRGLDDVPANFLSMVSLNWTVDFAQAGRVDDQLDLAIRIMNGTTVLAAADSGGTFANVQTNVTNTVDQTNGPTAFAHVNTSADAATWNGASIELQQTITPSMMADGCRLLVDFVQLTGEYSGSVQITHTTDLNVGFFVVHTTDLNVSEYDRPTDTNRSITGGASTRHKIGVDSNGTVWMVGVGTGGTPSTVRLWEGPATGPPGFWQLHEFDHGSGTTRDAQLAIVGSTVHIVYMNHSGSNIRTYHIEWPIGGSSFTNNGTFGVSESHSDQNASVNNCVDLVATSDGELVAYCQLSSYVSWPPYNTYRFRKRVYRSSSLSFSTGTLQSELYGPNIFDRPSPHYPAMFGANEDVYLWEGYLLWRFDNTGTLHRYYSAYPSEGPSLPHLRVGRTTPAYEGRVNSFGNEFATQGEGTVEDATTYFVQGLVSGDTGGDEIVWDRSQLVFEPDQPSANRDFYALTDHYGEFVILGHDSAFDEFYTYVSNGLGTWFETNYLSSTLTPWLVPFELVDRSIAAWHINTSGDWQYVGTTITTWYRAHTTDMVIVSADALVYHTTDMIVRNDLYGRATSGSGITQSGRRTWDTYNSKYYLVTGERFSPIHIWESDSLTGYGTKITSWHLFDISGSNFLEQFGDWDCVLDSSGVFHFLFHVYDNFTWQVLYWDYDIDTDTWTNNGSIYTSSTKDHSQTNAALITQRADGALIALFNEDFNWNYAVNTGGGFGASVSLATSTGTEAAMAVDGNDTHFLVKTSNNLYHWRLNSSDVLSARQGPVAGIRTMTAFPGSAKAIVDNNTMYFPSTTSDTPYVTDAATGSDAPTWTETQVSTKTMTRVRAFVAGVNGEPVVIFVEAATWKIWRVRLAGGSWVEEDTGQVLNPKVGQIDSGSPDTLWSSTMQTFAYPVVDSDGFAWLSWVYEAREYPADLTWHLLRVNLNPLEWHTTDLVIVEGSQVIVHTTDLIIKLVATVDHTTDLVMSELAQAAVSHQTDLRKVNRTDIVHTTDAHIAFVVQVSHTTDMWVVETPHDLSTTITLNFAMTANIQQASRVSATGLGIPRQGDQHPRIYNPSHKVVKK